jgi:peroxiredoxin Q/BCP
MRVNMVSENEMAPDFTLQADDGSSLTLSSLRGRMVVLYFYPKDDTPGCTAEACGIRDDYGAITATGAVVLGVSPDSVASHQRFKSKYGLPFTLLADPDHAVAEAYGVWVEKTRYGKRSMGIQRSTFIIDQAGRVAKVFPRVTPDGHSREILDALKTLRP